MRVLHFTSSGDQSSYFQAIAAHHDPACVQLYFGTLGPAGPTNQRVAELGLPAFALDATRRRQYAAAAVSLATYLRRERIQVMQAHLYDGCAVGLTAARIARVPARIFTGHHVVDSLTHLTQHGKSRAFILDAAVARHCANGLIAPSEHVRRSLVHEYRVPDARIRVIPYGFDFSGWRRGAGGRERMRRALGVDGAVVFAALGRLYWAKDLPSLLSSFAGLKRESPDIRLLLIGSGPEEEALRSQAAALGIASDVQFLGYRTDVPEVLEAVDVLVHPSLGEAFNQAIMEALAAGVLVVATDVGAAREVLSDERMGLVVEVRDTEALTNAMRQSLTLSRGNHDERRRKAREYTVGAMLRAYEEFYDELLAGARSRR